MPEMTIKTMVAKGPCLWLTFEEDPKGQTVKCWADAKFAPELKVGAKAVCETEIRKNSDPARPDDRFLKSWGGVPEKAGKGGGGGGFRGPTAAQLAGESSRVLATAALDASLKLHHGQADRSPEMICSTADMFHRWLLWAHKTGVKELS